VDEAALRRRLPPLRWKWPAPGEAAVAGFFAPAMPDAFDGPIEVPAALPSGARVVAIADGAFSPLSPDPRDDPASFAGRNDAWWRSNSVDLVVPEGVRSIGARAFAGFAPLRSVRLPTTLETIGPEAFADCIALERIELPDAVREIPVGAFKGCRALRLASAPGALRVGPFAFAACPVLAAVRLAPGAEIDPWAFRDSPHAEFSSHAEAAEPEPHAEIAEPAEPEPHAEAAEEKQ
ncbi:MAG: leucine-rich repeat domain-containing protein, partial [Kiritimatiellae bacterium]|nr:leucine-rich repeat domain-containing protein [Kiritimatiellia bacterium]